VELFSVARQSGLATQELRFKRGDVIYRQGDTPRALYLVESGLVGLTLIGAESGKEHLVRFFRPGQTLGHRALLAGEGYHGTAVVLESTIIKSIPSGQVQQLLDRRPELLRPVVRAMARELRACEVQHVNILEKQILSRTAEALVYLKDLHPEHLWTRQEIANFCASTVSTVIKAMAELEDRGLIRQAGRAIEILDRTGLLELPQDETF
jgi:CRP-like cAMP-binding protein